VVFDPIVIPDLTQEAAKEAEALLHATDPGIWSVEIQPQTDGTFTLIANRRDEQDPPGAESGEEGVQAAELESGPDDDESLDDDIAGANKIWGGDDEP
jgi:hypothetical protein